MALSIKTENFLCFFRVKAFLGEIREVTINIFLHKFIIIIYVQIPNKMIMNLIEIVEKIHENFCVWDKTTIYKRVVKFVIWHRKIINTENLVKFYFILENLKIISGIFIECSHTKNSIINIAASIKISRGILGNFFDFYKLRAWLGANHFRKSYFIRR
jgi:hypothetical protein